MDFTTMIAQHLSQGKITHYLISIPTNNDGSIVKQLVFYWFWLG